MAGQSKSSMSMRRGLLAFLVVGLATILPVGVEARCPSRDLSWCLQIDGFDSIVLDGSHFRNITRVFNQIGFLFEDTGELLPDGRAVTATGHPILTTTRQMTTRPRMATRRSPATSPTSSG